MSQHTLSQGLLDELNRVTAQRDELLDAISGLVDFIEIDKLYMDPLALRIAREAIAKAVQP